MTIQKAKELPVCVFVRAVMPFQHFFVARLDMAVDGLRNTVVEVEAVAAPRDPEANPFRNAFTTTHKVATSPPLRLACRSPLSRRTFFAPTAFSMPTLATRGSLITSRVVAERVPSPSRVPALPRVPVPVPVPARVPAQVLETERNAARDACERSARHWRVESAPGPAAGLGGGSAAGPGSPAAINRVGQPTAYALHPHAGVLPFAAPDAHFLPRAGFLLHHLWVNTSLLPCSSSNKTKKWGAGGMHIHAI